MSLWKGNKESYGRCPTKICRPSEFRTKYAAVPVRLQVICYADDILIVEVGKGGLDL